MSHWLLSGGKTQQKSLDRKFLIKLGKPGSSKEGQFEGKILGQVSFEQKSHHDGAVWVHKYTVTAFRSKGGKHLLYTHWHEIGSRDWEGYITPWYLQLADLVHDMGKWSNKSGPLGELRRKLLALSLVRQ